ncbi:unnamed protein product [Closterium sp. NIES-64]|nr:unnamed protein product [Closterium sp. NIES-64]
MATPQTTPEPRCTVPSFSCLPPYPPSLQSHVIRFAGMNSAALLLLPLLTRLLPRQLGALHAEGSSSALVLSPDWRADAGNGGRAVGEQGGATRGEGGAVVREEMRQLGEVRQGGKMAAAHRLLVVNGGRNQSGAGKRRGRGKGRETAATAAERKGARGARGVAGRIGATPSEASPPRNHAVGRAKGKGHKAEKRHGRGARSGARQAARGGGVRTGKILTSRTQPLRHSQRRPATVQRKGGQRQKGAKKSLKRRVPKGVVSQQYNAMQKPSREGQRKTGAAAGGAQGGGKAAKRPSGGRGEEQLPEAQLVRGRTGTTGGGGRRGGRGNSKRGVGSVELPTPYGYVPT